MSENRKILVAKRHHERRACPSQRNVQETDTRKGFKRQFSSSAAASKKNLANDRLKRLRAELTVDVQKSGDASHIKAPKASQQAQKRHHVPDTDINKKLPKTDNTKDIRNSVLKSSFSASTVQTATTAPENFEEMEWSPASQGDTCAVDKTLGQGHVFVVVDTNIFLSQLGLIKELIGMKGSTEPVIFIPWIVVEELDFIKEDRIRQSLKWKAQEAIKYIEKILSEKTGRMKGQTLDDVNEQKDTGKGQDNKIIACCFQVLSKYGNMILLTNDINLRNKARLNDIPVAAHTDIVAKILSTNLTKVETIQDKMTKLCHKVINSCAQNAYGPACVRMPICQTKVQSIQDCIMVFTKYWFPVFQDILLKQFKKAIDDLSGFLSFHSNIEDNSNEMDEFLRLCVRVCVFLKDIDSCKDDIESTIRELNDFKN